MLLIPQVALSPRREQVGSVNALNGAQNRRIDRESKMVKCPSRYHYDTLHNGFRIAIVGFDIFSGYIVQSKDQEKECDRIRCDIKRGSQLKPEG